MSDVAKAWIGPRHQENRLEHLARLMSRPVPYEDGLLPLGVSLSAASPATVGSADLATLMRAADAAMYWGKHTGRVILASAEHVAMSSVNGRRHGRPGTSLRGKAA